jgi:hypothetical protein
MIGGFFRPEELGEELIAGFLKRPKDRDKLAYKAFILGRQLAALERERAQFYKEQIDAAQQQNQMLLMMMNLQAKQQSPVLQGITPSPSSSASVPPPMPGAPTGLEGALGGPAGGPTPSEAPVPIPGQLSGAPGGLGGVPTPIPGGPF